MDQSKQWSPALHNLQSILSPQLNRCREFHYENESEELIEPTSIMVSVMQEAYCIKCWAHQLFTSYIELMEHIDAYGFLL